REDKHRGAVKQHLDVFDGQCADHGRRQEGDDEVAHERELHGGAGERAPEQVQQAFAKDPHDRQDRPELDDHFENLVVTRGEIDPRPDEQQVSRTGDGNEFREALDPPQKQGLQQKPCGITHSFSLSTISWASTWRRSISTEAIRRPSIFSTVNSKIMFSCCSMQRSPTSGRWPKRASMKPASVV